MPLPLAIDTDLGSDIDDELTLALAWGSPEVELLGVTTSYGDVEVRTRIGRRMAALAGRTLRVEAGAAEPLSGRSVWWAGHEGLAYRPLDDEPVDPEGGLRLLADAAAGSVHVLAIAPLTTVALALRRDPALASRLAGIWVMGGNWSDPAEAEHNILSDVIAAREVFAADCPITVVGVDVTRRVRLVEADLARIEATGPLGAVLAAQARDWMRRWDEDFEIPHDPLTALALIRPELFVLSEPGRVVIDETGSTSHSPGGGRVRVALEVNAEAAATEIVERIVRGLEQR